MIALNSVTYYYNNFYSRVNAILFWGYCKRTSLLIKCYPTRQWRLICLCSYKAYLIIIWIKNFNLKLKLIINKNRFNLVIKLLLYRVGKLRNIIIKIYAKIIRNWVFNSIICYNLHFKNFINHIFSSQPSKRLSIGKELKPLIF